MKFHCPSCNMSLMAEPTMAGKVVQCPGCNIKFQVPALSAPETQTRSTDSTNAQGHRNPWKEEDPTNPNAKLSFACGLGISVLWFLAILPFKAPAGKPGSMFSGGEVFANLFYEHFTISFTNVLFFCWGASILFLKHRKLKRQRDAMLLDVLPMELGKEINAGNVSTFIDHVYRLPEQLRDSLMVNRIRKALEFFEARQNSSDVIALMSSQSGVDGSRISGSYIIVRAFLWAIPLLGFIGTVIGLSHALSAIDLSVGEMQKTMNSLGGVIGGLGTAFNATLLGLVLAVTLNFPLNHLSKEEDEALNDIDAFCNEVLLPRLNDGSGAAGGEAGALADSLVRAITSAQGQFLTDLNTLSARMLEYSDNLDRRTEEHQQVALQEFSTHMSTMRAQVEHLLGESIRQTYDHLSQSNQLASQHLSSLDAGIQSLNRVLKDLGEKQVVIQQVKKKGWFSRD